MISKTLQMFCILCLFLSTGCAIVKDIQQNISGRKAAVAFHQIKPGMSRSQVVNTLQEDPSDEFDLQNGKILLKFKEGAVVEEKGVVAEAFEYKTIQVHQTINDLVSLGMDVVELMKNAGWPLRIQTNRNAHIFYYRTGTLLIKDLELINTFNRNLDYAVTVSSYKGNPVKNPVYYLVPSVPGIDQNSVEFLEVKDYVKHILAGSNSKVTERLSEATVILFVNFGVGDKQVDIMTYSTPIYRSVYTPGSTTTTQVQNRYGTNVGSFQSTTPGTYSSQYAGQHTSQYKVESYRRHIILEAIIAEDYRKTGERKYFWKTTTESEGTTGDFRAILPVLAYGTRGYVYKNSGKAVGIRIDFDQMMNYFLEIFSQQR